MICAVGTGDGQGFGSGTFSTLSSFAFNVSTRTTMGSTALGPAPAGTGFWTGVGCAPPNNPSAQNTILCAATTGTTAGSTQTTAVSFDPRTGAAPRFSTGNVFSVPTGAAMVGSPSCISLNVVNNQINCGGRRFQQAVVGVLGQHALTSEIAVVVIAVVLTFASESMWRRSQRGNDHGTSLRARRGVAPLSLIASGQNRRDKLDGRRGRRDPPRREPS